MLRKLATPRRVAMQRKLAGPRKPVGFVTDYKIHAVLDTNIVINAIWALSKGLGSTQTEKDCLTIIKCIENKKITIGINSKLLKEYQDKAHQHLATGMIKPEDVSYILRTVSNPENHTTMRMLVDPQKVSRDSDDDLLFDGLVADYLISDNLKDVKPERLLPNRKTTYINTLSPFDFVSLLKKRKIV